ncbi:hypothetical protein KIMC2_16950 [Xylocopilactobacillus apis]|uniref:Uncharacterized protein n=1 Tax=Xylocopilactobacillus apis TaxID=2932183 RepID=A0AAU9D0Q2_9LACO|nr:hypothetical protein KIMC2_16950 [Xylocopilactobacillus apis]
MYILYVVICVNLEQRCCVNYDIISLNKNKFKKPVTPKVEINLRDIFISVIYNKLFFI